MFGVKIGYSFGEFRSYRALISLVLSVLTVSLFLVGLIMGMGLGMGIVLIGMIIAYFLDEK